MGQPPQAPSSQPPPSPRQPSPVRRRAGRLPWRRPAARAVHGPGGTPGGRGWPERLWRAGWTWWKRILLALLVLVVLAVAGGATLFLWAGKQMRHVDALADYAGRPAAGKGTNWLLIGSDSRGRLTPEQRRELHVGNDVVQNTDTIMVLHSGEHGPYLVSLPRDSYVSVPGHGRQKVNAAFAEGGPKLLTRTVEQATGLRIDRYAEVSFLGFVQVVDAVGGVRLCPETPLRDTRSGADFRAGCQRMDGTQALAYVRARYADPKGDLGRVKRQRQLLGAVADETLAPAVCLDPFRLRTVLTAALSALTVDDRSGMAALTGMGWSMKEIAGGGGTATTVPVANPGVMAGGAGEVLLWDEQGAKRLFDALRNDDPIPTSGNN